MAMRHISKMKSKLRVGQTVRTNGNSGTRSKKDILTGYIGEIRGKRIYIWQNEREGVRGRRAPSTEGYDHSWVVNSGGDFEIEILKNTKPKTPKAKARKQVGNKGILLSEGTYNRICRQKDAYGRSRRELPRCFLLGWDNKKVVRGMVELSWRRGAENCAQMVSITSDQMAKGMLKLLKDNLVGCGLLRIGWFDINGGARGPSLEQICTEFPEAFILSVNMESQMKAERYRYKSGRYVNIKFGIVK